jgi:hypothetical protein
MQTIPPQVCGGIVLTIGTMINHKYVDLIIDNKGNQLNKLDSQ